MTVPKKFVPTEVAEGGLMIAYSKRGTAQLFRKPIRGSKRVGSQCEVRIVN